MRENRYGTQSRDLVKGSLDPYRPAAHRDETRDHVTDRSLLIFVSSPVVASFHYLSFGRWLEKKRPHSAPLVTMASWKPLFVAALLFWPAETSAFAFNFPNPFNKAKNVEIPPPVPSPTKAMVRIDSCPRRGSFFFITHSYHHSYPLGVSYCYRSKNCLTWFRAPTTENPPQPTNRRLS